jgi:galactose mutarotase-like enzyme
MKHSEPFRQILISAKDNIRLETLEINSQDVTPDSSNWSIRKLTLHGGKQEGVDLIIVDNGKLQFTVVPTRGMSVLSVQCGDVRLGWDSPVKEVVHPAFINLQNRGGLGWLEGFNEWLVRCGLESFGPPGTDRFINDSGEEITNELTLHGKIGNIPASEVEVLVETAPPYRIRLRGRVEERAMFGPQLELQTEISLEPNSNTFRISDSITNRGAQLQEFQLLYHVNYGPSLLEGGSTFLAPIANITPINEYSAQDAENYATYAEPTTGFREQVYCMQLLPDADGRTLVMLRNQARDRAASMAFSIEELPFFTLWKNTAAESDGYVTGLEPGTGFPNARQIEREQGRVPQLAPGATCSFHIDFGIHSGEVEIQNIAARITNIQGKNKPVLD